MNILKQLREYREKDRKTVIYCAGLHGILFYNVLKTCGVSVDFFSDSDSLKWGKVIADDIVCISPEDLKKYNCVGFICVGKTDYVEIYNYVCRENLFEVIEISCLIDELISDNRKLYFKVLRCHAKQKSADLFYDLCPNKKQIDLEEGQTIAAGCEGKTAVYTAVFGGYDLFCSHQYLSQDIDYFYVSDTKPIGLPAYYRWIDARTIIPEQISSPVKRNRFIKMHPHLFLKDYSYSVYIDGNVIIKDDISAFLRRSRTGIAVFLHPMRECIYYEALSIANFKRVNVDDVCRQMSRYFEEGMPCRYGLTEMPVIVREHMKKECRNIMETWWQEFNLESQRDQLSFMYALWKSKFCLKDLACLGNDVRNCRQIAFCSHIDESRNVKNELMRK